MSRHQSNKGPTLGDILTAKPNIRQAFEDNGLAPLFSRRNVVFVQPANSASWADSASAKELQAQVVEKRNGKFTGNMAHVKLASKNQGNDLMIKSKSGQYERLSSTKNEGIFKGPELATEGEYYKTSTIGGDAVTPKRLFDNQMSAVGRPVAIDLANRLATNYSYNMLKDGCKSNNCYLSTVAGLVKYLQSVSYDRFDMVKNLVDYNPVISFYILVQPFRKAQSVPYLIDDETMAAWVASDLCNMAMVDAKAYLLSLGVKKQRTVNAARVAILQLDTTDQMKLALKKAYLDTYKSNQAAADFAMAADEFRFFMAAYFDGLWKDFSQARFREILDFVQYCMPGNDLEAESYLLKLNVDATGSEAILKNVLGLQLLRFLNSSASLYYSSEVGNVAEGSMTLDSSKVLTEFYNITFNTYSYLEAFTPEAVTGLSHDCQQELKDYLKAHGNNLDSLKPFLEASSE